LLTSQQQAQPHSYMLERQSQHAWIISQRHSPMVKLQVHTVMPLSMTQQLHMPPWSMVQRFCIMLQAILSSHEQLTFMPPAHFSNFIVHRGTMT